MTALIINAVTIAAGSLFGMLIKSRLSKTVTDTIMVGIGFFTVYIGISGIAGAEGGVSSIVYLLAVTLGGVIGAALKIDEKIDKAALKAQNLLTKDGENHFATGFTGFFVISFVGAFTLIASFNAGLGDNTMLITKSVMDLIVSMAMAASLGIGVLFAGIPILLCELALVCFAAFLSSVLSASMIEAFSCMGSILTIAIGTNVTGLTDFKVVNYLPSLLIAPLIVCIMTLAG